MVVVVGVVVVDVVVVLLLVPVVCATLAANGDNVSVTYQQVHLNGIHHTVASYADRAPFPFP